MNNLKNEITTLQPIYLDIGYLVITFNDNWNFSTEWKWQLFMKEVYICLHENESC